MSDFVPDRETVTDRLIQQAGARLAHPHRGVAALALAAHVSGFTATTFATSHIAAAAAAAISLMTHGLVIEQETKTSANRSYWPSLSLWLGAAIALCAVITSSSQVGRVLPALTDMAGFGSTATQMGLSPSSWLIWSAIGGLIATGISLFRMWRLDPRSHSREAALAACVGLVCLGTLGTLASVCLLSVLLPEPAMSVSCIGAGLLISAVQAALAVAALNES